MTRSEEKQLRDANKIADRMAALLREVMVKHAATSSRHCWAGGRRVDINNALAKRIMAALVADAKMLGRATPPAIPEPQQ